MSQKKKNTEISYSELMAEIENFRRSSFRSTDFSQEQINFLKSCRDRKKGLVPWHIINKLWIKKWGDLRPMALKTYYYRHIYPNEHES